jgi:hypothetical protein
MISILERLLLFYILYNIIIYIEQYKNIVLDGNQIPRYNIFIRYHITMISILERLLLFYILYNIIIYIEQYKNIVLDGNQIP